MAHRLIYKCDTAHRYFLPLSLHLFTCPQCISLITCSVTASSVLPGCLKVSPKMLFVQPWEELSKASIVWLTLQLVNSKPGNPPNTSSQLFGRWVALSF